MMGILDVPGQQERLRAKNKILLSNMHYMRNLSSQCLIICGSTVSTALSVTWYFGDLSVVLVVDGLRRKAVNRRFCVRGH